MRGAPAPPSGGIGKEEEGGGLGGAGRGDGTERGPPLAPTLGAHSARPPAAARELVQPRAPLARPPAARACLPAARALPAAARASRNPRTSTAR